MTEIENQNQTEDICYICLNPETPDNPLTRPCTNVTCMAKSHVPCLVEQVNHKNMLCGICKSPIDTNQLGPLDPIDGSEDYESIPVNDPTPVPHDSEPPTCYILLYRIFIVFLTSVTMTITGWGLSPITGSALDTTFLLMFVYILMLLISILKIFLIYVISFGVCQYNLGDVILSKLDNIGVLSSIPIIVSCSIVLDHILGHLVRKYIYGINELFTWKTASMASLVYVVCLMLCLLYVTLRSLLRSVRTYLMESFSFWEDNDSENENYV